MTGNLSYLAALLGGVLALLSPCSALLLPSFFAYAFQRPTALLARTGLFYLGLAVVLVPLGTGTSLVSHLFLGHRQTLITIAGWTVVGFGVLQILGHGFASRRAGLLAARAAASGSRLSIVGLGATYGLSGFCAGPILGSVLTLALASGGALRGASLLAVYALGMTVPLYVLAALWTTLRIGERAWLRGREVRIGRLRLHTTSLISGGLFIAVGVIFLRYDGTAGIATPLLGGTGLDYHVQMVVSRIAGHVSDRALLIAAVVLILGVAAWRLRRAPGNAAGRPVRAGRPSDPAEDARRPARR